MRPGPLRVLAAGAALAVGGAGLAGCGAASSDEDVLDEFRQDSIDALVDESGGVIGPTQAACFTDAFVVAIGGAEGLAATEIDVDRAFDDDATFEELGFEVDGAARAQLGTDLVACDIGDYFVDGFIAGMRSELSSGALSGSARTCVREALNGDPAFPAVAADVVLTGGEGIEGPMGLILPAALAQCPGALAEITAAGIVAGVGTEPVPLAALACFTSLFEADPSLGLAVLSPDPATATAAGEQLGVACAAELAPILGG